MYIDSKLQFLDDTSLADAKDDVALFGDVIDLGTDESARQIFEGQPLYLVIFITAATSATATAQFKLHSGTAAALSSPSKTHVDTGTIANGSLTKGAWFAFPVSYSSGLSVDRYMGIKVTTAAAAQTSLKATAFLSDVPFGHKHVASDTSGG